MKKYLLIVVLSMIGFTATAQQLSSGNYTVTISNVKSRSYTDDLFGTKYDITEYIGNYTIAKKGSKIQSQEFSTRQMGKDGDLSLFIEDDERSGNALSYNFDTKKYEIAHDKFKPESSKDINNIILSGILIYAKWLNL